MRPGQNKRMRGRNNNNNNRKGPNPLTRSYESNGPDVKIRGTAHHIGEKYLQLARDAHSSGDPVRAESYLQHAEHYFRVIAAAQQAQQVQNGYGRPLDDDDDDDGDDGSMPDRFASPAERQPPVAERQPFQGQPNHQHQGGQTYQGQQGGDRGNPSYGQHERAPNDRGYDNRNGRNYDNRSGQDRNHQDRNHQDRNYQDRGYGDRQAHQDRGYGDRGQGTGPVASQNQQGQAGQAAPSGGQNGGGQSGYERGGQGDRGYGQDRQSRHEQGGRERDFDNRQRGQRPPRPAAETRSAPAEEPVNSLPAFITAPSRNVVEPPAMQSDDAPQRIDVADAADAAHAAGSNAAQAEQIGETAHLRPRRRRRPKVDFAEKGEFDGETPREGRASEMAAQDPVGE